MLDIIINALCPGIPKGASSLCCYGDPVIHALLALGYPLDALPYAELIAMAKQLPAPAVVVSLVHWQASHNDAMFLALGQELGLDARQLRIWFEELSPLLNVGGSRLSDAQNGLWLLSLGDKECIKAAPPASLRHQSLMPAIAALGKTGIWQTLFTEAQMFLHAHPLNSQGSKHAVNGLWFWGGGVLSDTHERILYTDNAVLQYLGGARSLDALSECDTQDAIIVLDNPDKASLAQCQHLVKKQESRWYWLDRAYALPIQSWWTKLKSRGRKCE